MLLSKFRAYLELMRFVLCSSAFIMAIVGYWLSIHQFDFFNIDAYLAALAVTTALAFANVLNDIFDLEGDSINYPSRPIPAGIVPVSEAGWLAGFLVIVSLVVGFLVGWGMFLFTIFLLAGSAAYDIWAKRVPILGKFIVALLSALTLLAGYFAAKQGEIPFIPILVAFFFIWARELIETISDDAGDQVDNRGSVYALWGKTRVLQLVFVLLITSVIMLLVPLFTTDLASRLLYLLTIILLLILPITMAAIAILRDQSPMNIRNVAHWVGVVFFSSAVAFLWLI